MPVIGGRFRVSRRFIDCGFVGLEEDTETRRRRDTETRCLKPGDSSQECLFSSPRLNSKIFLPSFPLQRQLKTARTHSKFSSIVTVNPQNRHYHRAFRITRNSDLDNRQAIWSKLNRFISKCIEEGAIERAKEIGLAYLEYMEVDCQYSLGTDQLVHHCIAQNLRPWISRHPDLNLAKTCIEFYQNQDRLRSLLYQDREILARLLFFSQAYRESKTHYRIANFERNAEKFQRAGYSSLRDLEQTSLAPVPNFLVIGAGKSGTSSLYRYLIEHPNILSATEKELHFFNRDFELGFDWYQCQFPHIPQNSGLMTGEATPWYYCTFQVARKVKSLLPNVKLIIVLRNPVDRAFSYYKMAYSMGIETRSFSEAIAREFNELKDRADFYQPTPDYWKKSKPYILFGLYFYFLEAWLNEFPREQLLIIKSEDLKNRTEETVNRIFEFLGLEPYPLKDSTQYNTGAYEPMSDETRAKLVEFFQPHNRKLEDLLGMRFNWDEGIVRMQSLNRGNFHSSHSDIEKILRETYYKESSPEYLETEEFKNDLQDHIVRRYERTYKHYIPWIEKVVNLRDRELIEIGCGTGSSTAAFASSVKQIYAYEISELSVAAARARMEILGISNASIVRASPTHLLETLQQNHRAGVAAILLFAVLEHMTISERIETLKTAWDLLLPGGILIVAETPNRLTYRDFHTSWLPFFHMLPLELAVQYGDRSPRYNFKSAMTKCASHQMPDRIEALTRWGNGVSFHEFEIAFEINLADLIVADGDAEEMRNLYPITREEELLQQYFLEAKVPQPRSFSNAILNLIFQKPG